jgi:DMSO reductase anchor subunit
MTDQKEPAPIFGGMAEEAKAKDQRRIVWAQVAIIIVAVLTIIFAIVSWISLSNTVKEAEADPNLMVDQGALATARILIGVTFGIGLVYCGLFFWANKKPFEATLIALILYLANIAAGFILDQETLRGGWGVKLLIILALAKGVQAGWSEKKLEKSAG